MDPQFGTGCVLHSVALYVGGIKSVALIDTMYPIKRSSVKISIVDGMQEASFSKLSRLKLSLWLYLYS